MVYPLYKKFEDDPTTLIRKWRSDPVEFCKDVLGLEPLKWQGELMRAVAAAKFGLPNRADGACLKRFAVKSGTGVGKTFTVSALILWMLAVFDDAKIPCTAPTSPQLKAVLWPELRKLVNGIDKGMRNHFPFDVQTDRITMLDNFAAARTAREENPEGFQGFHAKNIMLVADEASGVPEPIFLAGQGVMAEEGAVTLLIGNPTRASGFFYDCFHSDADKWWTLTVPCTASERVSKEYIDDMRAKHGEDSYEFKVRVMGEFHLDASGTIIPRPWFEDAIGRNVSPDGDWIVWGVDVSDGRDKSGIAKRQGNILLEPPKSYGGVELMTFVNVVAEEYWNTPRDRRPDEICVDAIGMGTGFAQRLRDVLKEFPVRVIPVNVALTGSQVGPRYRSRRVELWARGRAWFESGMCSIPEGCKTLGTQLCAVEWEVGDDGKWKLLDKAASGSSPEQADSFLLTFGGSKRDKSVFTKDTRGRKIEMPAYGVGSASYLAREGTHGTFNRNADAAFDFPFSSV